MAIQELELIENLKSLAGENSLGLTDDCAVFGEYCITKDLLSEGVHFFKNDSPFNLARKAIRVNLSDLAAMGAEPFGVLIGVCLSKQLDESWVAEFNKGLKSDIEEFGFQLLGGDTVFHDAPTVISITALGKTNAPLLRSTAKIGDNIFVSGKIGDSYIGLKLKEQGKTDEYFTNKYELPTPRLELGVQIRSLANACMDISDGLLLDLSRMCQASNVGAEIYSKQIPISESDYDIIDLISGGDDYELLFTSTESEIEGCHKIGKVMEGEGVKLDDSFVEPKGYIHK